MTPTDGTELAEVSLWRPERHVDTRGASVKVFSRRALAARGLDPAVQEVLTVVNDLAGTIRGLHYQAPPFEESKTLWCTSGEIYDVVVDVRPDSPSFGSWESFELSADNGHVLHIPAGFAHGYQTLTDGAALTYLMSADYQPGHGRTVRWDDPTLAIPWPLPVSRVSESDDRGTPWPPPCS